MPPDKKPGDKPAEVKTSRTLTGDPFTEIVSIIIVFMVVMALINGALRLFRADGIFANGWSGFTLKNILLKNNKSVSSLTNPIDSRFIVSVDSADVFSEPGGKKIRTAHFGEKGTVVGGPMMADGVKYWQVKFDDGSTGWIKDSDISNFPDDTTPLSQSSSLIGGSVRTKGETSIYDETGKRQIGTEKAESDGKIIEGPKVVDGQKFYHVKFADGKEGWVKEGSLNYLEKDREPLSEKLESLGTTISTNKNTPVYDSAGGKQFATETLGQKGKITGSPETVNGTKYWPVRFLDGVEGWVKDSDISPYVPAGTVVSAKMDQTPVYENPGGKLIATESKDKRGEITGSSQTVNGTKYWPVRFDDGTVGWVKGGDLNVVVPNSVDVVTNKNQTPIHDDTGRIIKYLSKDVEGKIVAGPKTVGDVRYWEVSFTDGTFGWVRQQDLDAFVLKPVALSSKDDMIGSLVATSRDGVAVYDSPAGLQIATEDYGEKGKIIEGPLVRNGVKYWHIKFDNGTDGWVKEDDLNLLQTAKLGFVAKLVYLFWKFITYFKVFIILFSIACVVGIVQVYRKLVHLRVHESKSLYTDAPKINVVTNKSWERVLLHLDSLVESDWKLAVVEADIMLSGLTEKLSLQGETIAEKLKTVEVSDFKTIDMAWEAHKVRNKIVHESDTFRITQREAKRVVELYRQVFQEFHII